MHDEPFSPADDAEMLRLHALWPLGQFKKIARGLKPPRHKAEVKERLQWL